MMKQSDSKRGRRLLLWGSVGLAVIMGMLSFVSVRYTVVASRNGDALFRLSLTSIKKLFTPFPHTSSKDTAPLSKNYPSALQNPPVGAKVIKNRFVASQNFPEGSAPSSKFLLAVASACGYNKTKGLQCGGATSVFRDIKGVCAGITDIPYDPCCGAAPQIDPRDPEPSCPEPSCSGSIFCFCSSPPEGCTCLPLACNCVCAARAGGGEFAWLWDSVTGFCGCNP